MFVYFFKFLRFLIYFIDFILLTLILYLASFLPTKVFQRAYHRLYRHWSYVFTQALNVKLKLHQHNIKPLPNHYILIANHPSSFEDIGVPALFDVYSLAKLEVKSWFMVGRIGHAAGNLFFCREDKAARKAAADELVQTVESGKNIALYPEGGCKGRRIHFPFLYGAFDVAIKTNTPILPIFLHYESQDAFEWQNEHLLCNIWSIFTAQNKTANYHLYDVFHPKDFKDKDEFSHHVYQQYLKWQEKHLD